MPVMVRQSPEDPEFQVSGMVQGPAFLQAPSSQKQHKDHEESMCLDEKPAGAVQTDKQCWTSEREGVQKDPQHLGGLLEQHKGSTLE